MMKNIKKIVRLLVALLLITLSFAGCKSNTGTISNSGSSSSQPASSQAAAKVPIVLAVWGSGATTIYDNMSSKYNASQNEIDFSIQMQSGDFNAYLATKIAANDLPDLFYAVPYTTVQKFAQNGQALDLSDRPFVSQIYSSSKPACEFNGKIYAYPFNQDALGIFYNKDMFTAAGITAVPKTVTEFKDVCAKLTAKGMTPIAAMYKDSWTSNHVFSCLQAAALNSNLDAWTQTMNASTGSFKVPNTDKVFNFLDIMKANSGKNIMDSDAAAAFNDFAAGKAAMLFEGDWGLIASTTINPNLPIGLFAAPVTDNAADAKLANDVAICIIVNKSGKNIPQALKVLDFMSDNTDKGPLGIFYSSVGAGTACMPFTGYPKKDYFTDMTNYLTAGNVYPWIFQHLPSGTDAIMGTVIQGYMAGTVNEDKALTQLDTQVKALVTK
jgi:raffinose/stachyose/melibiose transport system substrate-binding protein